MAYSFNPISNQNSSFRLPFVGTDYNDWLNQSLAKMFKNVRREGTKIRDEAYYTEEEMKRDLAKLTRDISTQTQQGVNLAEEASAADPNAPKEVTEARKRGVAQKGQEAVAGAEADLLQYKDQRDFTAQQFMAQLRYQQEQMNLERERLKMQKDYQQEQEKWAQLGFLSNAVSMFVPMAGPAMNFLGGLFKQGNTNIPSFSPTVQPPAPATVSMPQSYDWANQNQYPQWNPVQGGSYTDYQRKKYYPGY